MTKIKCLFVFLIAIISQLGIAQSLVNKQEGVKSIATYKVTKDKRSLVSRFWYNENGNLTRMDYNSYSIIYEHTDTMVIGSRTNSDKCLLGYRVEEDEQQIIMTEEELPLEGGGKPLCPYGAAEPVFENVKLDSLFTDIQKEYPKNGNVHHMQIRKKMQDKEYIDLRYWRNFFSKKLELTQVTQRIKITNKLYSEKSYFYRKNTGKMVLLSQAVLDQNGSVIKDLGAKKLVHEMKGTELQFKYKYDKEGNWIKRYQKNNKKGKGQFTEREISYY